jgi:hypothetical protein
MPTQLYAKIKKSSKYYSQNQSAIDNGYGLPFPVEVAPDSFMGYVIKGGPGGQYTAKDVNLYAIVDGEEIKLS